MNFSGKGTPLSQAGFDAALAKNGIDAATLWAVLEVETSGAGYFADRRPKILFERHIFSRLTDGTYDASNPDISNRSAGGYGDGGVNQYNRLATAFALDKDAALQSASWGIGQIMGENHEAAGFSEVTSMVNAMVLSEDAQLGAMSSFLSARRMAKSLQSQDWKAFASSYNGPNYAKNRYDEKLERQHSLLLAGPLPDLTVRTVQVYLTYKGCPPLGGVDGVMGSHTATAIKKFQGMVQMPVTGDISDPLIQALAA